MRLDAVASLLAAIFTVAACWGAGILVIERVGAKLSRAERFPLAFILGASLVHLFVFAAMALHVAYKPVWVIAFTALIVGGVWRSLLQGGTEYFRVLPRAMRVLVAVISIPFTVLYLANAWAPETSPDGASYHLEIIARYLRAHRFERILTNMY